MIVGYARVSTDGQTLDGLGFFCDDLSTRQRWARYAIAGALPRASKPSEHCAVYCVSARSLQGFLARLTRENFTDVCAIEKYFDRERPLTVTIRYHNYG